jgi:hypothetical protein
MSTAWPAIRRWLIPKRIPRRRTLIALGVVVLLVFGHALILRMLAWPLVAGDAAAAGDCFCIHGGELGADGFEPLDAAARWHGSSAGRKILLVLPRDSRIVEVGAVRSFEQTCRSELKKRGIPAADVISIRAEARNLHDEACALSTWLQANPDTTVLFACSSFGSGQLRHVLDKVLDPADVKRVRLAALSDPACTVETWWRSRRGVKEFMYAWLGLLYAWVEGDSHRPVPPHAARFQDEVRARIGTVSP